MDRISKDARTELLQSVAKRYQSSTRPEVRRILDEFLAITSYHRKHAIRLLNADMASRTARRRGGGGRRRIYDEAVLDALIVLWEASDRVCGKRLKSNANPTVVRVRHGVVRPRRSEGMKFQDLAFCKTRDTFDLDAELSSFDGATTELRVVGRYNPEADKYQTYVTTLSAEAFSVEEIAVLYSLRWIIELLSKLAKSSCHLDHLDTANPDAIRTHIYVSLLAATVLSAVVYAAAKSAGIPVSDISLLTVGIAAPLMVLPLMILWGQRELTHDELAAMIVRMIVHGCREQNPGRSTKHWGALGG